jgi:glycosyltransferase involved in cell wall biosynthesis
MSAHDAVGGGARHARSLARGLRELGVRVSLLCTGDSVPGGDADYDEIIACQPRAWPLLWRVQPFGSAPFWYRTIRRTAPVDAVISLSAPLALATHWTRPNTPLLFAPAMLDKLENPGKSRSLYAWFEEQAFRRADRVLVRSPAVRQAIEIHYGPLRCPTGSCLPGIDDRCVTAATRDRAELGIPTDAKLLITVGVVNENKGQRHIARALARCAGADWWWVLIGSGEDEPAVRAELRGSSVASRVRFVGVDRHPADWYAAADLLVAASRSETFGQAIAEAICAGVPVVIPKNELGTSLSPLATVVERYGLGYTFSRRDPFALTEVLTAAIDDAPALRAMSARGPAFARMNFVCENYAECALCLLESPSDLAHEPVGPAPAGSDVADDMGCRPFVGEPIANR